MRSRWWLVAVCALVGAFVAVLVIFDDSTTMPASNPNSVCPNGLFIYFNDDEQMERAAENLKEDLRVKHLVTQTKQQLYDAYMKSDPEKLKQFTPGSVPAILGFSLAPGFDRDQAKKQLQTLYWEAKVLDCSELTESQPA